MNRNFGRINETWRDNIGNSFRRALIIRIIFYLCAHDWIIRLILFLDKTEIPVVKFQVDVSFRISVDFRFVKL